MKLQDQVCTMDQAKRLKELGVAQKSLWYWNCIVGDSPRLSTFHKGLGAQDFFIARMGAHNGIGISDFSDDHYSAFTDAELGVMYGCENYTIKHITHNMKWSWLNDVTEEGNGLFEMEAEARADCLIRALEKGYSTLEEVNQRISA